jgi:hypothetical protein
VGLALAVASFLFASGFGEANVSGLLDWARREALKNRPPQAKAITAKHEINFSWVFIGLLS